MTWKLIAGASLLLLSLLLFAVPFATSGQELWLGIDWIDGRKLYSIDDAYRYFVAKHAFEYPSVFLWNYILPVALVFDAAAATLTDGSLQGMRLIHAGIGALTLLVIWRASLRAGCGPGLAMASVLIVGLMPLYLVLSSSFYGEGLFALLLALVFLLLIEERMFPLAVLVGLMPLVRPDGAVYSVLFLLYFLQKREFRSCAVVILPAILYFSALLLLSDNWLATFTWRLELRRILDPFDANLDRALSLDRWLNPLWAGLALSAVFFRDYRKWWPVLLGPWLHLGFQVLGIARGVQDFELRYYFALLPVFAVAWALPVRKIFDACYDRPRRRVAVMAASVAGVLVVLSAHLLQSDWIRESMVDSSAEVGNGIPAAAVSREFGERTLWFDPGALRGFARRVDRFVASHSDVQTLYIANPSPLYFLEYPAAGRPLETILIPHNPGIARYSGGYFFGFSLDRLAHRYYRFSPGGQSGAMFIVDDTGQDPFADSPPANTAGGRMRGGRSSRPVSAIIQSGSMKAFEVSVEVSDRVKWVMPDVPQER